MTRELIEEITLASIVQGWGAARDGKVAMASFADRSIGFEETCDRRTAATLEFIKTDCFDIIYTSIRIYMLRTEHLAKSRWCAWICPTALMMKCDKDERQHETLC